MKKLLSILLCFTIAFSSFLCASCGNKSSWQPPRNVIQNLPNKIHVEYNGIIFVKDGDEYYCQASNIHGFHRTQMYMKRNLSQEVCIAEGYGGWRFITAITYEDSWIIADTWNENDKNQNTYTNAEYKTRTGYIDVNTVLTNNVTLTKLDNQVLNIGGNNVECVVWDFVYENGDTYGHSRYWYAVNTGVFIKEMYTSDKNEDIEIDGTLESVATYYGIDESMEQILNSKGLTKPDLSMYN